VPLHELLLRLGDVPAGKLWVHCGSGYRAGIAASLLQRAGRDVVHIDARFAEAASAGIALDTTAA
jgi:hydroxyacylglutathione hydrolase